MEILIFHVDRREQVTRLLSLLAQLPARSQPDHNHSLEAPGPGSGSNLPCVYTELNFLVLSFLVRVLRIKNVGGMDGWVEGWMDG